MAGAGRGRRGHPRRSRAWAKVRGTHQAGALETRVGVGQEVGPFLVKLPLILTAWGGLPERRTGQQRARWVVITQGKA